MKTVLTTTSASVIFTPGAAGAGKLNFAALSATSGFSINRLMAVINQTRNTVIYAEAQSTFGWSNWDSTKYELTLNTDTSTHVNTDSLQVVYDTASINTVPSEEQMDAVNKPRSSQPQSLIDTDFEYGLQPTKWEFVNTVNNKPTAYYDPTSPVTITGIAGAGTRVVTVTTTASLPVGTPVYIQDSLSSNANGWYLVETSSGSQFTYTAKGTVANASIYDSSKTSVFQGYFYTGSGIPLGAGAFTNSSTTVTCTTQYAHGLAVGDLIYVIGTTAVTSNPPNGSWVVATTPNATTFTFTVVNAPVGAISNTAGSVNLYSRPTGWAIHRAFDGGVQFTCGSGAPNASLVRQTRRYFRYQAGKGIQFSTGTIFRPAFNIDLITSSGTAIGSTVTVNTKTPHGLQPGCYVNVSGSTDAGYNGTFEVQTVPSDTSFTYLNTVVLNATTAAGFPITVSPTTSYGNTVRVGFFDQQNGIFFEHDGQYLYAVRRNSTQQIAGTVAATNGSNVVTGTGTAFSSQLAPGDNIVIKGMSYRIVTIASDTSLYITPEYKGSTISTAIVSKTIDTRIRQDAWNIDKMDGTGPSNFKIDVTKMQMLYIDYSWYGAGFVRWGFRAANGNVTFCHKMINNNTNTEAYMRSGNLPGRYEENTLCPVTTITATVANTETATINVKDTSLFPNTGIVRLVQPGNTSSQTIEYIKYTGKTATTLTGLTRIQTGGNGTAQTFTYSATAPTNVELMGVVLTTGGTTNVPPAVALSHWGSSVIMDGRFDNDLNFNFNAGHGTTPVAIAAGATDQLIMAIRLGPTVDSGKIDVLGIKEIINRMQLKLASMDIIAKLGANGVGGLRINFKLNGRAASGTFIPAGGSSLAQIVVPTTAISITGGESVYGFYVDPSIGTSNYSKLTVDLSAVRDLGNSILGGGTTNSLPSATISNNAFANLYPDGPDIIYITATNLDPSNATNVFARLSWTEAQA